jgi:hypothetical protein
MRKAFDWKRSRISLWELEAVPKSCIPLSPILYEYCFICEKLVASGEFSLLLNHQYILVSVFPNCFRFAKMCLCQLSILSRCSPRYLTSSWASCTLFIWTGGYISLRVVNVTWIDLDPLAFILHFFKSILDCD